MNGKIVMLNQNLYKNIKSRIKVPEGILAFFPCNIGARQSENLSQFLFAIFPNDLEHYLNMHGYKASNVNNYCLSYSIILGI